MEEHSKPVIVFTRLSPFDIAFYDTVSKAIVIDYKFRDSPALQHIIVHETRHSKSKGFLDFKIESEKMTKQTKRELLRIKPLAPLSFLMPIVVYSIAGRRNYRFEPFRIMLFFLITSILYMLTTSYSRLLW